MSSSTSNARIVIDEFALNRQWKSRTPGRAAAVSVPPGEFAARVNAAFEAGEVSLVDGYAPFCKHLFMKNFVGMKAAACEVTEENEHLLKSGYVARNEHELPVLTRWFPRELVEAPEAAYLDVILYSREQILKENEAMGKPRENEPDYDWGVVSVKPQQVDYEQPMQPITMMRNALGKDEGGSGVPLDREQYVKAVEFWSKHAPIQ